MYQFGPARGAAGRHGSNPAIALPHPNPLPQGEGESPFSPREKGRSPSSPKPREVEASNVLMDTNVRAVLSAQGFDIKGQGPESFKPFIDSEIKKWTQVVKASGAQID
jgi:hypothetical protein